MLRDVVDLRQNKWIPRREEPFNPKTIDQICTESRMEKMQQQKQTLVTQIPVKKNSKPGNKTDVALCRVQGTIYVIPIGRDEVTGGIICCM